LTLKVDHACHLNHPKHISCSEMDGVGYENKECSKEWAKTSFATEITEFSEKNSKVSVDSVAKPTELDTP